ncbi:MAG: PRC-barrel domain containing protein [Bradyrhizobiaceae bacterium]|nr:MAG: PRC-barrel domain containing protein [Bradyrhizobiaceae bacterium]
MPTELHDLSSAGLSKHSTSALIGSDRVQGTSVFDADGARIGTIACVMIEKISGRVSFVVMNSGGFLGIGETHYPLPWPALKYNVELGGYQIMIPVDQIKEGPTYDPAAAFEPALTPTVIE